MGVKIALMMITNTKYRVGKCSTVEACWLATVYITHSRW